MKIDTVAKCGWTTQPCIHKNEYCLAGTGGRLSYWSLFWMWRVPKLNRALDIAGAHSDWALSKWAFGLNIEIGPKPIFLFSSFFNRISGFAPVCITYWPGLLLHFLLTASPSFLFFSVSFFILLFILFFDLPAFSFQTHAVFILILPLPLLIFFLLHFCISFLSFWFLPLLLCGAVRTGGGATLAMDARARGDRSWLKDRWWRGLDRRTGAARQFMAWVTGGVVVCWVGMVVTARGDAVVNGELGWDCRLHRRRGMWRWTVCDGLRLVAGDGCCRG